MLISTQAVVLAICNALILLAVILSMFVIKKNTDEGDKGSALIKNVVALLFFFVFMALQVYSLNCMIYGDCRIWAWILVGFAVLGTVLYMAAFLYIVFIKKKEDGK
jgi:hypothetical protein